MKTLGLDFGKSKIGVAIAESEFAEPLKIIKFSEAEKKIINIIKEYRIEKIVIGISEGSMAEETRLFALKLGKVTPVPIEFEDETLTSMEAIDRMREVGKQRKPEDAVSAAIILQSYLDRKE